MKAKKFTDEQKVQVLSELDRGAPLKELSRKHGVSEGTIYYWKKKLGGLGQSDVKKLRALEEENRKLKRVVADLTLDNPARYRAPLWNFMSVTTSDRAGMLRQIVSSSAGKSPTPAKLPRSFGKLSS